MPKARMNPSEMAIDFTQGFGSFYFFPDDTAPLNNHKCSLVANADQELRSFRSPGPPPTHQEAVVDLISGEVEQIGAKADDENAPANRTITHETTVTVTNVFPFMRLPLELRIRVYDLLISSLISSFDEHEHVPNIHEKSTRGIKFQLCDGEYRRSRDFMDYHNCQIYNRDRENSVLSYLDIYKGLQDGTITPQTASGWHFSLSVAEILAVPESGECELDLLCSDVSWEEGSESSSEEGSENSSDQGVESSSSGNSGDYSYSKYNNSYHDCVQDHIESRNLSYVQINAHTELHSDDCEDGLNPGLGTEKKCCHRLAEDYEDVRRLAYISRQFTAELGACIWRNSVLDVKEFRDLGLFLRTRPAAAEYVRGLIIHVEYNRGLDMQETQLEVELNCAGQQMDLLFISLRYRTTTDITDHNEKLERLRAILSFNSTREVFDLKYDSENFYVERGGPGFTERSGTLCTYMAEVSDQDTRNLN